MGRFVVLALAGETPVLFGPEKDDFLEIATALLAGGRASRLHADPTMVAFDDLWIRPGTMTPTVLREAAEAALGGRDGGASPPATALVVVAGADRSGARFWHPALVDCARRGRLPRRLLVCVTVDDPGSEEAEALPPGSLFNTAGVTAEGASSVAPVLLAGPRAVRRELDPGERPDDLAAAVPLIGSVAGRLSSIEATRLARIYVEASRMMPEDQAEALARETLAAWGAGPTLTVVANGGGATLHA